MRPRSAVAALAVIALAAVPATGLAHTAPTASHIRTHSTHLKRVHPGQQVRVSILLRVDHAGVVRRLRNGRRAPLATIVRRHHASDRVIATVGAWARAHGLRARANRMRTRVILTGTARSVERAFGTRLDVSRLPSGQEYVAAPAPVDVPASLTGVAEAVAGLEPPVPPVHAPVVAPPANPDTLPDLPQTKCRANQSVPMTTTSGVQLTPLTPTALATQYGLDGIGTGAASPPQTIAVIEFDQQYLGSDVAIMQSQCGLTAAGAVTLRQVNLPGAQATVGVEASLDADVVATLAPANTSIVVINASQDDPMAWADALDAAARLPNLTVVSASYGASETCIEMGTQCDSFAATQATETALEALAASGVTIAVSSGDQGSMGPPANVCADDFPAYGLPGYASVNFPASSAAVTAVGGTMWSGQQRGGGAEGVWNEPAGIVGWACGVAGGGGGQSVFVQREPWQVGPAGQALPGLKRLVPDVALLAGQPGYLVVMQGALRYAEGTSAAAPLLASAVLRITADRIPQGGRAVGFLNPALYGPLATSPGAITDLTTGTNDIFATGQCCTAGPGYDMASGLGVPNFGAWEGALP